MENKQENVVLKKSSIVIVEYAAAIAAAVGLGYLLGNKETRNKIWSSINKRPRKEWHSSNQNQQSN